MHVTHRSTRTTVAMQPHTPTVVPVEFFQARVPAVCDRMGCERPETVGDPKRRNGSAPLVSIPHSPEATLPLMISETWKMRCDEGRGGKGEEDGPAWHLYQVDRANRDDIRFPRRPTWCCCCSRPSIVSRHQVLPCYRPASVYCSYRASDSQTEGKHYRDML